MDQTTGAAGEAAAALARQVVEDLQVVPPEVFWFAALVTALLIFLWLADSWRQ